MKGKKTLVLFLILCFLTVLIVVSSVLFSVKTVVGYCYNSDDATLTAQVVDAGKKKVKNGDNIFLIKEKEIISAVEKEIASVKVINIERRFPSTVYINYIKLQEYFVVKDGDYYLYVSNDCKILRKTDKPDKEKRINLYFTDHPSSVNVGERLFGESTDLYKFINEVMVTLSRLEKYESILEMLDVVDLRFIEQNMLYIKTSAGVSIEIQHPDSYLLNKVQWAVTYLNKTDLSHKSSGTIIVARSGNDLIGSYSEEDRYQLKLDSLKKTV